MTTVFRPRLVEPDAETSLASELERLHALLGAERQRRTGERPASAPDIPPTPRWAPLAMLAERLGLDTFTTDLMLLLLAPELEPGFATLYGLLDDDPARRWPTLALAQRLFAGDLAAARAALLPTAPLVSLRIVAIEGGDTLPLPMRSLRLEDAVLAWLLGKRRPDQSLASVTRPLLPALLDAEGERRAEVIARRLVIDGTVPRLRLTGPARSGRRALATAVAARLGLVAVEIDLLALPMVPGGETAACGMLGRDAALLDLAWVVDEGALDRSDRQAAAIRDRLRRSLDGFVVLLDLPGSPAVDGSIEFAIPAPTAASRQGLWRRALPHRDDLDDDTIDDLAATFELGPHEIVAAVEAAGAGADPAGLRLAARGRAVAALGGFAERVEPASSWGDLVLPDATTSQLREVVAAALGRRVVQGRWGMARGERDQGLAVLFSGPSGTGKTTAAEVIAGELDLDLWRIDLATTVSKWIGETEKNLKSIFDAAEMGGSILFFDEADALFGKRSEVKDSRDRYANIEIDYLLQRMERHRGLAILATNRRGDLDPAFQRRLRHVVQFPFPDAALRRAIWAIAFPPSVPTGPLDLDALAALELAGGSIRNVALNAACLAAAEGSLVEMAHLLHAARREYDKLERLPQAPSGSRR